MNTSTVLVALLAFVFLITTCVCFALLITKKCPTTSCPTQPVCLASSMPCFSISGDKLPVVASATAGSQVALVSNGWMLSSTGSTVTPVTYTASGTIPDQSKWQMVLLSAVQNSSEGDMMTFYVNVATKQVLQLSGSTLSTVPVTTTVPSATIWTITISLNTGNVTKFVHWGTQSVVGISSSGVVEVNSGTSGLTIVQLS